MNHLANSYQTVQHQTTDRGGVLILLYDGILKEIRKATQLLTVSATEGDPPHGQASLALLKAQMGVVELDRTLNYDAGPELAEALHSTYLHALWVLSDVLESGDPRPLNSLHSLLGGLRDAWSEAVVTTRQNKRAG